MTFCISIEVLVKLNPIQVNIERAFIMIIKEAGRKFVQ